MRFAIQILALAVDLPLQVLIVAALIRGTWRRFPLVLALSVVELISALVQAPGALQSALGRHAQGMTYETVYWFGETINRLLVYAVVISLLYQASERLRSARPVRFVLILGACLLAGGTFLAHYDPSQPRGLWLTPWFRDLNFTCAIMDIMLWTVLLVARGRDRQLLLLSGGLGVEFAGDSIGESLRQMSIPSRSVPLAWTGSAVIVAATAFRLYAWWRALRRQPVKNTPANLAALREHGSL
jgi:hypothetical protein